MQDAHVSDGMIEALLRLAAVEERQRISSIEVSGQTFWIKRFNRDDRAFYKAMHRAVALLPLPPSLRPSPAVDARGAAEREMRKSAQFSQAGFPVPDIVFSNASMVVTRHMGETVDARLNAGRQTDTEAHDALIVRCAETLAAAHAAGLCHGRPHPRDMLLDAKGRLGFMDFEEEPEAAMPLATAQARDCWLLFLVIADLAIRPETAQAAFERYKALAPADVIGQLQHLVRFWHVTLNPVRRLNLSKPGADLRRLLKADTLFNSGGPTAAA